jgi:hypothetical protein
MKQLKNLVPDKIVAEFRPVLGTKFLTPKLLQ